ncbi:MAG: hypothetical protein J7L25_04335, partial [Deltaproteobacteria bacterium]|nr:hypothetical protein [Candidatus Tharpella aukensis]
FNEWLDNIKTILKKGSPVSFGLPKHQVALTQCLKWNKQAKCIIWNNNQPYDGKNYVNNINSAPYQDIILRESGFGALRKVRKRNGECQRIEIEPSNDKYSYCWLHPKSNMYTWTNDSQYIYGFREINSKAAVRCDTPRSLDTVETINYNYPNHLRASVIGAGIGGVTNFDSGETITLVPNGEILPNQAVITSTMGGSFNFIYLPKDHKYRISATKLSDIKGVKVFVGRSRYRDRQKPASYW